MEFWKQLLALTLTPTLTVVAIAWLIRKLFESGLQRDLERFKSELESKRFEHQTRFSLIHQKRAEVLSNLYSRLACAKSLLGDLVAIFQPGGQLLPEKKKKAADSFNDASSYFFEHRIFLNKTTAIQVEEVISAMREAFVAFDTSQLENVEYRPDSTGLWMESYNNVRDKISPLLSELEMEFRKTLGFIEENR